MLDSRRVSVASTAVALTEEKCCIGEPHPSGVDTIALVGAAKVTVTYP